MTTKFVLGIIPARGGSKGVIRKNIRPLCGKPLLAYAIEAANESKLLSRTLVSTEDVEIREVARMYGAEVPFLRPPELATDDAPIRWPIQHAVRWIEAAEKIRPDIIVTLQPASPLRRGRHIDEAVTLLLESGADSVISLCEVEYTPYYMKRIVNGKVQPLLDEGRFLECRQHAPVVYRPNGVVSVTRYEVLMEQDRMLGEDTRPYLMSPVESINIDTEWDFTMAELLVTGHGRVEPA